MNPGMDTWLLTRMQELRDLQGLIGLATWDMETYLPSKAGPARSHQLSTLQGLHHERLVDPRLGRPWPRPPHRRTCPTTPGPW